MVNYDSSNRPEKETDYTKLEQQDYDEMKNCHYKAPLLLLNDEKNQEEFDLKEDQKEKI